MKNEVPIIKPNPSFKFNIPHNNPANIANIILI